MMADIRSIPEVVSSNTPGARNCWKTMACASSLPTAPGVHVIWCGLLLHCFMLFFFYWESSLI